MPCAAITRCSRRPKVSSDCGRCPCPCSSRRHPCGRMRRDPGGRTRSTSSSRRMRGDCRSNGRGATRTNKGVSRAAPRRGNIRALKFFEQQESARWRTRRYILWLALLAIPCIASMCIATLFSVWFLATAFWQWFLEFFMSESEASALLMNTPVLIASVVIYTALIFWYLVAKKRGELSRSGEHVAGEIGATLIRRRHSDLSTRQLHNIAEEMALAAGVPAPAVYLWPTPEVINAFVVGHTTADAAIFVSQGAIDALSRDEMQSLIGHRMSQVLNGDMALNSRLASYLYAFRFAPRVAKWWLFFPSHSDKGVDRFKAFLAWLFFALWIGIALSIVTF